MISSMIGYDFVDDWGEKNDGIVDLSLFVLDIQDQTVRTIGGIDSSKWTVGQPCFLNQNTQDNAPTSHVLVYTAWSTQPRKLGMIYCYQRSANWE